MLSQMQIIGTVTACLQETVREAGACLGPPVGCLSVPRSQQPVSLQLSALPVLTQGRMFLDPTSSLWDDCPILQMGRVKHSAQWQKLLSANVCLREICR